MATNKELQAQIEQLQKLLEQYGITAAVEPTMDPTKRGDYIAHGSPEHAAFLGLVEVEDVPRAKEDEYILHTSPVTGKVYRLADEMGAAIHYPDYDPQVAAKTVLRQKVSSFESGPPKVPEDAPPMWMPREFESA